MFGIRRHRGARRCLRGAYTVTITVGLLITSLTSPAWPDEFHAKSGGSSGGTGSGGKVFALSFYPGQAGATQGSSCTVENYEGNKRFYIFASADEDGIKRISEFVVDEAYDVRNQGGIDSEVITNDSDDDGEADIEIAAPNPQLVDTTDNEATTGGTQFDSFTTDLKNGRFDVEGQAWGVWKVTCNPDEEDKYNIVSAPLSPQGLIPPALTYLENYLPEPELSLEPFDDELGWAYVQTAIDFRTPTETLQPFTLTADTGGPADIRQWITITATPSKVVFDSGDPLASEPTVECPAENADDPYVPETPGPCSHTFRNSSSVADNNVFETELSIVWDATFVDSNGGSGSMPAAPTVHQEDIAVAEIQVVTDAS